ncbi:hypothetical protein [Micromonospora pisi]|nr:hypothetical protein [Micromonospora pisi]
MSGNCRSTKIGRWSPASHQATLAATSPTIAALVSTGRYDHRAALPRPPA